MMRTLSLACAALLVAACGSDDAHTVTAPTADECTPEAACSACGSCLDACLCGGGTEARCESECTAPTDAGAPPIDPPEAGPKEKTKYTSTLVMDAFDISPGQEVYRCQNFPNPFQKDVAVRRVESFMTNGSHHMFVFIRGGEGSSPKSDLQECGGLEFGPNLHTAQRPKEVTQYPDGVGRVFNRADGVRLQVHYFNASEDTVHTELAVTVFADNPEDVAQRADQIFINSFGINVAPHSSGVATTSCNVPKDVSVFATGSHMHQHGVGFSARASDGQLLYETDDWSEPPPWVFDTPRKLRAGTTINVRCDYENSTAQVLTFGESAKSNEMCIFLGSYYPAEAGPIQCLF